MLPVIIRFFSGSYLVFIRYIFGFPSVNVSYFVTKRSIFDQKRNKLRFEVFIFLLERFFLVPALFPTLKKSPL